MMLRWSVILAGLWLTGCPEVEQADSPAETCTKLYAKCKLPSGPLGVCEQKGMNDSRLVCTPQH